MAAMNFQAVQAELVALRQQNADMAQAFHTQINAAVEAAVARAAATAAPPPPDQEPPGQAPRGPSLKPLKPPPFTGHRRGTAVRVWLGEIEGYIEAVGAQSTDREKIQWAASLLRDDAQQWWNTVKQRSEETRPQTWAAFESAILLRFEPVDAKNTARHALLDLRQTSSLDAYVSQFLTLTSQVPTMGEEEKTTMFVHGLQPSLRVHLLGDQPDTLDATIQKAARFDLAQHGDRRNRPPQRQWSSGWQSFGGQGRSFQSSSGHSAVTAGSFGPAPMDLSQLQWRDDQDSVFDRGVSGDGQWDSRDAGVAEGYDRQEPSTSASAQGSSRGQLQAMQQRPLRPPPLTTAMREELIRKGGCFRCRQAGHIAARCPAFPSGDRSDVRSSSRRPPQPSSHQGNRRAQ